MSPTLVLLVTRPGAFQEGLRALLMATGRVTSIVLAHDDASANQAIQVLYPAMVIVEDRLLKQETPTFLQMTVAVSPNTKRIVVTDTVKRKQVFAQEKVDFIFLPGTPAEEVGRAIEKLLPPTSLDDPNFYIVP